MKGAPQGWSRRQLALLAGAAPLARAQAPAAPAAGELEQARQRLRAAAADIRKVKTAMPVEPCFRFQP